MSMVVVVRASPLLLRWIQAILLASSIAMLGYCAFVLLDSALFQQIESRKLERGIMLQSLDANQKVLKPTATFPVKAPAPIAAMGIGRIAIPRLGLSVMVVEGTGDADLRHAAGHISGTALPGQVGNIGISAHRDTFFRPLRNIRDNDIIAFTTLRGEYRYRVVAATIVDPSDVSVLAPGEDEILTLVTCYPFYFAGPAPSRFVVRAVRVPDRQ